MDAKQTERLVVAVEKIAGSFEKQQTGKPSPMPRPNQEPETQQISGTDLNRKLEQVFLSSIGTIPSIGKNISAAIETVLVRRSIFERAKRLESTEDLNKLVKEYLANPLPFYFDSNVLAGVNTMNEMTLLANWMKS